ncbi:MAG: hypothetical protein JSW30_02575 [Dehalococcoidia bacterium]|nr:MAG: hypothetical protein JSW30_02575 [Dehalococcoidia bacterium]
MLSFLRQIIRNEKGQALPTVLALLALGGLTIAPTLSHASTSLNFGRILQENVHGIYAADAGVEKALWCLGEGTSLPEQLTENINQQAVAIQTEDKGDYTFYLGEFISPGEHNEYLSVDGEITWDDEEGAYKYVITVVWEPDSGIPVIHLEEVGLRLPLGYSYQSGSAAGFAGNLSTDEPDETLDTLGAYLFNWELGTPAPSVSEGEPVKTQTFYITGSGDLEGDYTWVVADREDIGAVGEITGTSYRITATAIRPGDGKITARIVAEVMISEVTTYITSWLISK